MKGDKIELDETLAEAINRDSPGVLTLTSLNVKKSVIKKGKDRMVKGAENRRLDRAGDPGDKGPQATHEEPVDHDMSHGPITKADFKAVRG
jgi:hypothetical protein